MRVQIFDGIQIFACFTSRENKCGYGLKQRGQYIFTSSRYSSETVLSVTMQAFLQGVLSSPHSRRGVRSCRPRQFHKKIQ